MWFDRHLDALGQLTGGLLFRDIKKLKYTGRLVKVPNIISDYEIGAYVPKPAFSANGVSFTLDENTTCLVDSSAHADYLLFYYADTEQDAFFSSTGFVSYTGVVA
jgi:hypothetical protein